MADPATPKLLLAYRIIAGVNDVIRITDESGANDITLTAGEYFISGDDSGTDLVKEIHDAFDANSGGSNWTVALSAAHKVTFTADGGLSGGDWEVNWSHANTTFPATVLGAADNETDTTNEIDEVSTLDYQHQYGWYGGQAVASDTYANKTAPVAQTVTPGALVHTVRVGAVRGVRNVGIQWEAPAKAHPATATTNESWREFVGWASDGRRCRYYPDATDNGTYYDCVLDESTISAAKPMRHSPGVQLYSWPIVLKAYA